MTKIAIDYEKVAEVGEERAGTAPSGRQKDARGARSPQFFDEAMPSMERWLSGLKRRFAKPLYGVKSVPRVRIPPFPNGQRRPPSVGYAAHIS